jgi:hypothetical protein
MIPVAIVTIQDSRPIRISLAAVQKAAHTAQSCRSSASTLLISITTRKSLIGHEKRTLYHGYEIVDSKLPSLDQQFCCREI